MESLAAFHLWVEAMYEYALNTKPCIQKYDLALKTAKADATFSLVTKVSR